MGVVNTSYTFLNNDVITSTRMNDIIDQTTFTSDALVSGNETLLVVGGKLQVKAGGINSNELASDSVVTAKIANDNVTTAKIADANVTQAKLAANVVGNGPAFRAYASTTTTVPSSTFTKVNLVSETFDSNSNFSSSRFTPTVAGYYMICGLISYSSAATGALAVIRKNGADHSYGSPQVAGSIRSNVCDIIEMNGSSDYIELFAYHTSGTNETIVDNSVQTYLSGCLIRSA